MFTARRILRELADADERRAILTAFWKHADTHAQLMAQMQLAKALHFRDETIRKMPPEKKADLLAARIASHDFDQVLEIALMQYHTHEKGALMGAFLDRWNIPHQNGSIEGDEYTPPTEQQVSDAVSELGGQFSKREIALYLATAGLLMGGEWRDATWPIAEKNVS